MPKKGDNEIQQGYDRAKLVGMQLMNHLNLHCTKQTLAVLLQRSIDWVRKHRDVYLKTILKS